MKEILKGIRHAQWRWDYTAAGHGSSFHSPVETGRIVSGGIAVAQEARLKLSRLLASLGHNQEIPYPDISTKEKAQEFIGLEMVKIRQDKEVFLQKMVPEWIKTGKEREKGYDIN